MPPGPVPIKAFVCEIPVCRHRGALNLSSKGTFLTILVTNRVLLLFYLTACGLLTGGSKLPTRVAQADRAWFICQTGNEPRWRNVSLISSPLTRSTLKTTYYPPWTLLAKGISTSTIATLLDKKGFRIPVISKAVRPLGRGPEPRRMVWPVWSAFTPCVISVGAR